MFGFGNKNQVTNSTTLLNSLSVQFDEYKVKTDSVIELMIKHENDNSARIKVLEDANTNLKVDLKTVEQRLTDHRTAIAEVSGLSDKQEQFMELVKDFLMTNAEFETFCQDEVTKEEIREFLESI